MTSVEVCEGYEANMMAWIDGFNVTAKEFRRLLHDRTYGYEVDIKGHCLRLNNKDKPSWLTKGCIPEIPKQCLGMNNYKSCTLYK